ncbi:MAG: sigma-70 family RNA polymerase sigma factor [bacterium]
MANFEPRNDDELSRLDDEALLEHIALARARGQSEQAQRALAIIVFRYHDDIVRRVAIKVPRADVEDVAQEAVVSAIRSKLDGKSIGEFRSWLNRIVGRRIADFTRKPSVDTTPLPEEHGDDESIWGTSGSVPAETGEIEINELVEIAMQKLSEAHREVIERFVFEGGGAADTVDHVNAKFPDLNPPMSEANVSQIAKRFRTRLRELLEESDNPG